MYVGTFITYSRGLNRYPGYDLSILRQNRQASVSLLTITPLNRSVGAMCWLRVQTEVGPTHHLYPLFASHMCSSFTSIYIMHAPYVINRDGKDKVNERVVCRSTLQNRIQK